MKSGIDYFPLDVDLDEKFELIEAEFGLTGFGVVVRLLQRIYGVHGYYIEWTDEVALLFAKRIGMGGSVVSEIINAAIKRGMFHKDLYDKYQILTSNGIQKRYFEAVSRRKEIEVDDSILLVNVDSLCRNVNIKRKNVNKNQKNVHITKQSKEEKRRVEESKEEESDKSDRREKVPYQEIVDCFNQICTSLPSVQKITDKRQRAIMARWKSGTSIDEFKSVFKQAESSDFLTGRSGGWGGCGFDWILNPTNWVKIQEGNYRNGRGTNETPPNGGKDDGGYGDLGTIL